MNSEKIIVIFKWCKTGKSIDLEIPLNISANELIIGLTEGLGLEMNTSDLSSCALKTENPIALLRGAKLLKDYGLRNGTIINYTQENN